jgi:GT2 family glycosyltransferase
MSMPTPLCRAKLLNEDGSLRRWARRADAGGSRRSTLSAQASPHTDLLNPLYGRLRPHDGARGGLAGGAALLARRAAADVVGLFDESFFMFGEEVDWLTRFRGAGWKVYFDPAAEVAHVGGASHGGNLYVENVRGHLRWFAKHRGPREAEHVRRLLLAGVRLRALVYRGERGAPYRDAVRFLRSGTASELIR